MRADRKKVARGFDEGREAAEAIRAEPIATPVLLAGSVRESEQLRGRSSPVAGLTPRPSEDPEFLCFLPPDECVSQCTSEKSELWSFSQYSDFSNISINRPRRAKRAEVD